MRITLDALLRLRDADKGEHLDGPGNGQFFAHSLVVSPNHFHHLILDGIDGIEGGHGILKNHRNFIPPEFGKLGLALFHQILAAEEDFPFLDAAGFVYESHN